ncbi:hypothetical protein CCR75_007827 [Bremia lactucae]|uniref:Uncharacterized protein n=1 Tax=Bremia lactucae TaxID=4779 RepID=A0A976FH93_BRELC|nr:hypothetical protein CCR75_007827 [Bremia lactucae]
MRERIPFWQAISTPRYGGQIKSQSMTPPRHGQGEAESADLMEGNIRTDHFTRRCSRQDLAMSLAD